MTRQIRGLIRFSMGLLVGLALMTSCGGDPAGATEVGELGMTLSTTNGDVVYRLRDALFQIRGPENKDVCSEVYKDDQPDEPIIVALRSGNYQVAMDLGTAGTGGDGGSGGAGPAPGTGGGGGAGNDCGNWWMEYSASGRAYEPIDAVLVSVNPMDVRINTGETTHVYFGFEVDGRLIDFGPGTLAIGIDVTEEPPIGGGAGGAGGTGGMVGTGGSGGVPPGWTCDTTWYGTDDGCDCGCGVIDLDCADGTVASCDFSNCPGEPNPTQNWLCGG